MNDKTMRPLSPRYLSPANRRGRRQVLLAVLTRLYGKLARAEGSWRDFYEIELRDTKRQLAEFDAPPAS